MKFTKFIKSNWIEVVLITIIGLFFMLYFVVYLTPSKIAWYDEMNRQANALFYEIMTIGR